jgi:hypothetical protein
MGDWGPSSVAARLHAVVPPERRGLQPEAQGANVSLGLEMARRCWYERAGRRYDAKEPPMTDETSPRPDTPAPQDKGYLLVVMALLVVIVVTLAALWMLERRGRRSALAQLDTATQQISRRENLLKQLVLERVAADAARVNRSQLPRQDIQWNGRAVKAYALTADAGKAMGFEPGDVVLVLPEPASAASQSQSAP